MKTVLARRQCIYLKKKSVSSYEIAECLDRQTDRQRDRQRERDRLITIGTPKRSKGS